MLPSKRLGVSLLVAIVVTAFAAAASATAPAPAPAAAAPKRVTSVEGITEYRLGNGLRVLLFPDPSVATITVNLTYLVGSRHENYGETGMAHLLEHMMLKGSTHHTNIGLEMTRRGADYNASTWYDRTNYYETFAATEDALRWAVDLEADRMVSSFIAKKDLDSEMTVVRNEFEAGENDPLSILDERVLSTAFLWHNYGKSTIGARSDIENVPIERLQAFYRTFYRPDNAVLLVAGRFDEARTLDLVSQAFGKIKNPVRPVPAFYTADPVQDGERSLVLQRVGGIQAIEAAYHVPPEAHPDFAAVALLESVLDDEPAGRLYKALVETKKATSVGGLLFELHDPGFVALNARLRVDQSLDEARAAFVSTLDAIAEAEPVTQEEVDRARARLLKNIALSLADSGSVGLTLSESIGAGDWRLFFLQRDRIRSATVEDVRRVAKAYLKPSNRTIGVFVPTASPDRAEMPPTPDVAGLVHGYTGDPAIAAGEAFDPSPANIDARTKTSKLASGLKVALLTKKTRGGTVVVALNLRFGDEKSLTGRATGANLAGDMLLRGTTKRTRQQINDELDRLKARMWVSARPDGAWMSIETVHESLPAVLTLAREVLREPAFPDKEFEELRGEDLAAIEDERTDPQSLADNFLRRQLAPYPAGDPRHVETFDEALASYHAATLDDAKKFYRDFYGASVGEIAIVGDFAAEDVSKQLADLFGDWTSPRPFERVQRPYREVAAGKNAIETPDKANAVFSAGMNLPLRDDAPDYPALELGSYLLGGSTSSRLWMRIREHDGLSYGVGSGVRASSLDVSGSFHAFAICAPENAGRVESAFQEEVARVLKSGFDAKEIADAKAGWQQEVNLSRVLDSSLAPELAGNLFLDRTFAWDTAFEKKVQAVTGEQILAALRKYVDPAKLSVVKVGDFAGSKASK